MSGWFHVGDIQQMLFLPLEQRPAKQLGKHPRQLFRAGRYGVVCQANAQQKKERKKRRFRRSVCPNNIGVPTVIIVVVDEDRVNFSFATLLLGGTNNRQVRAGTEENWSVDPARTHQVLALKVLRLLFLSGVTLSLTRAKKS